ARVTTTLLPSTLASMPSARAMVNEPSGPLQLRLRPCTAACTPCGSSTGTLPILLMCRPRSLDLAQHLAAEVLLAADAVGEDATRSGEDGDAEAADDRLDVGLAGVDAAAGGADPGDGVDRALTARPVLELDLDGARGLGLE